MQGGDDVYRGKPEHGHTWGNWMFDAKRYYLDYTNEQYDIDLSDLTDSARVLDWIAQVNGKAWMSPEDTGHLVEAINDIFHIQSSFCPGGVDQILDAPAFLKREYPSGSA
jgi:hypothetical protein